MHRLANQVEAILYLKSQALDLETIAAFADCDRDSAADAIIELMGDYAHRNSALEIIETADGSYSLQLKESYQNLRDKIIPAEIGTGALRTLAAIALKGPIPQSELVELRGSGAYQHVQELADLGLIRKRRQSGNRSSLIQVTDKFRQTYELSEELQQYLAVAKTKITKPEVPLEPITSDPILEEV